MPNAQIAKLLGRYWGSLVRSRRVIVPANGWYEWVQDPDNPKKKLRWHIHRADCELLYMAGISLWKETEKPYESGFVTITAEAQGSMVNPFQGANRVYCSRCSDVARPRNLR
ncbi:SOS response-associated peptidase family protein [Duganella sp. LjRoot269]|uniref:SOS response-associated peptidase family protein n=1 Tax=Duganella sp. LjRoot269 TaxID=3342305 RepID=UPI003F4F9B8F